MENLIRYEMCMMSVVHKKIPSLWKWGEQLCFHSQSHAIEKKKKRGTKALTLSDFGPPYF
jgi:hypothetical protein